MALGEALRVEGRPARTVAVILGPMGYGLLNDVLFKIVFGSPNSEPVLRALLNALLGYTGKDRIASLSVLNPTLDKEYLYEKGSTLDIRARDLKNQQYNIEVQISPGYPDDYLKRSIYYLARLFCEQLEKGNPYKTLARTISISLLDFVMFPDTPDLHSQFRFIELNRGQTLSDVVELHYIELRKFSPDKPHHLRSAFERWLYVLKFSSLYENEPLPENLLEEEGIPMAIDSMKKAFATDEVREMILAREKAHRDIISLRAGALEEGRAEGRQEGRVEGRVEGLLEGLEAVIDVRFGEEGARLKTLAQSATLEQLSAAMAAVRSASLAEMEALLIR